MKNFYYIVALVMMSTFAFTSCSKNEDKENESTPEKTTQTEAEKHFKSATAIYKVTTSNADPYFNISFSYLDENGKEKTATASDNVPFELTFAANLKTKLSIYNIKATAKDGVNKSEKPYCSLEVEWGFDVVDAINGKTYSVGQRDNRTNNYCTTFDEVVAELTKATEPSSPICLDFSSETQTWAYDIVK